MFELVQPWLWPRLEVTTGGLALAPGAHSNVPARCPDYVIYLRPSKADRVIARHYRFDASSEDAASRICSVINDARQFRLNENYPERSLFDSVALGSRALAISVVYDEPGASFVPSLDFDGIKLIEFSSGQLNETLVGPDAMFGTPIPTSFEYTSGDRKYRSSLLSFAFEPNAENEIWPRRHLFTHCVSCAFGIVQVAS